MKIIDLNGSIAVVTGGTGALGRTMVRELAACGADIAFCYHSNAGFAQELKQEVEDTCGVNVMAVQADITDYGSVMNMKNSINKRLGKADIIVNNSVIQYDWKKVLDQDIEDYESQFRSCVLHGVYMAKAFIPDMINKKHGRVIGINTECTIQMFEYQSAYVGGKRGMDGVYKVLAREVAPYNITVNQVAPGWIKSEGCGNEEEAEANQGQDFPYVDMVPMGRHGTDKEVADAVCFLASDMASFITGAYLPVTGGNIIP